MATLPASIGSSAPSTVALSPNRCPMAPPGSASAIPGAKYNPIKDADIGDANPEFAAQQWRDRGHALKLECHGGANRKQDGEDAPAIAHAYPFSEGGVSRAVADAMAMKTVKSTIVPWPELAE